METNKKSLSGTLKAKPISLSNSHKNQRAPSPESKENLEYQDYPGMFQLIFRNAKKILLQNGSPGPSVHLREKNLPLPDHRTPLTRLAAVRIATQTPELTMPKSKSPPPTMEAHSRMLSTVSGRSDPIHLWGPGSC